MNDIDSNVSTTEADLFYHHNSLGSVVAVTDLDGDVVEEYSYTAYGELTVDTKVGTTTGTGTATRVAQPFGFTGRRHDYEEASDLLYYRLRYYDPVAGRFVSRDPLGLWGDPSQRGNGQTYCGNNPINRVDPLGLDDEKGDTKKPKPKNPREIYDTYQVDGQPAVYWHPLHPLPFEGRWMPQCEVDFLGMLSLYQLQFQFQPIVDSALEEARDRFPDPPRPPGMGDEEYDEWKGNDGHQDAFRHAYWSALLAKQFGQEWAEGYTTAHEALEGNPAARESMDLYNNEIGREIQNSNPNATPEELADLIEKAVKTGETVVVDSSGDLDWSDKVPVGGHGLTPPISKDGVIPPPEAGSQNVSPN